MKPQKNYKKKRQPKVTPDISLKTRENAATYRCLRYSTVFGDPAWKKGSSITAAVLTEPAP
ncbi:hypothetical protein [Azospirillum endophyticum]